MGFCSCLNKFILVVLNFIIFAVGIGVIVLASVVIHRSSEYGQLLFDGILTLPIWTLVVGIVVTLLGFFGCCGALKESRCMLICYATVVSILFLAELTLGILVALYPEKAEEKIRTGMSEAFQKYDKEDDSLTNAIDTLQHDLKCCGVNGPTDWVKWSFTLPPPSCCIDLTQCTRVNPGNLYQDGCFDAIVSDLGGLTLALGITAVVLGVVQVMCVCIACALVHRKSQYV